MEKITIFNCAASNFSIHPTFVYETPPPSDPDAPRKLYITADILVSNNVQHPWLVSREDWSIKALCKSFPDCVIYDKAAVSGLERAMREALADLLESIPPAQRGILFTESGMHVIDGQACYVAGRTVIGHVERPFQVSPSLWGYALESNKLTVLELSRFITYLSETPVSAIAFCYTLLSSLQSTILNCAIPWQSILLISGGQGKGKSTTATNMCCPFSQGNAPYGFFDAGSTSSALHDAMASCRDMPLVVDDLCLSSNRDMQRKRKDLGAQLIRSAANKSGNSKKSGKERVSIACQAGLVLTAEFTMDAPSDVTRCIQLPVDTQQTGADFHIRQWASAAFAQFIVWFVGRYEAEKYSLTSAYQSLMVKPPSSSPRLSIGYFLMHWALSRLIQFAVETNAVEKPVLMHLHSSASQLLGKMWRRQLAMLEQLEEKTPDQSICQVLWKAYSNDVFKIKNKKFKLLDEDVDAYDNGKQLFLKPVAAINLVRSRRGYHNLTKNQLSAELSTRGILSFQSGNGYTVKIDAGFPRCYRINLDALERAAQAAL